MIALPLLLIISAPFVGSFLALAVRRTLAGESIVTPRSHCPACKTPLKLYDLVPVLSWLLLQGRCRVCGTRISVFYPAVEMAALAIAIWAFTVTGPNVSVTTTILGWILLYLGAVDALSFRLPDPVTLGLIGLGLAVSTIFSSLPILDHIIGAATGFFVLWLIAHLYEKFRNRPGLGLGDAKLFAAAGAWTGWHGLPTVLIIAAASALLAVGLMRLKGKNIDAQTIIPFGPFLCLGLWLTWLYGPLNFSTF